MKHWQDKKRVYVISHFVGTDVIREFHIFIEADKKGEWRIVIRDDSYAETRGFNRNMGVSIAYSVKMKRADKDDFHYKPSTFYLTFLDSDGNEKWSL